VKRLHIVDFEYTLKKYRRKSMKPVQSREAYEAQDAELDRRIRICGYAIVVLGVLGTLSAFIR
jgi:hypothetical protein